VKINVTQVLRNLDGTELAVGSGQMCPTCGQEVGRRILSLRETLVDGLTNTPPGEQMEGKKQLERFNIALRIQQNDEVKLEAEEIALCKDAVAKRYKPIVTGQVWMLLEGEDPLGGESDEGD
jgi:hypothetical protein